MTRLRYLRMSEKISAAELARQLGLHFQTVGCLERGERQAKHLRHAVVVKLEERYGLPVSELLAPIPAA